jgi:predicted transcriptional regulator
VVPKHLPGGELEYTVLRVLFELRTATAREVHQRVGAPEGLAYTTIATVLDRLHDKRLVRRRLDRRAFVYRPCGQQRAVDRARARQAVERLLGPAPRPAMAALVDAVESTDSDLLDELARLVSSRRKSRRGS